METSSSGVEGASQVQAEALVSPKAAQRTAAQLRDNDAVLSGPIAQTLLRRALPGMAFVLLQGAAAFVETFFVSRLGDEALAGISLVGPFYLMMYAVASGGFGAGVSAVIAKALVGDRREDAEAIAVHAVALALGIGGVFALLNALCGRQVFAALGGSDEVLNVATTYASIVFTGAFGMWIFNTLAAILRGAGRMGLPSLIGAGVALSTMFLSPAFVLGLGPFPRLGVAGAGVVAVAYQLLAMSVLLVFMTTSGSPLRLRWPSRFEIRHFRAVLGIAGPSALSTVVTNLTIVVFTGAFGAMGAHGLAAYGAISRLEYLFMLGTFGLGMALAPMVSANLAAGHVERARQCAWIGAGLCAALTGLPGLVLALQPELWVGLFSREPAAVEIGARYLRTVAPFYGLLGASLGLFFAAQGLALARSAFAWNGARLVVLATLLVAVGAAGVRSAGVLGWVAAAGFAFYATGLAITVARGGRPPPDDCDR